MTGNDVQQFDMITLNDISKRYVQVEDTLMVRIR